MFDVSKLSPAPWEAKIVPDGALTAAAVLRVPWRGTKDTIYFGQNWDDAAFIADARNAFDVMTRRGWTAVRLDSGEWAAGVPDVHPSVWKEKITAGDPFTAIIEADKWYTANVEQPANLPLPTGDG